MSEQTINAILVKPGEDPKICKLPVDPLAQKELICDLLEGNFGAAEFFDLKNGTSLFVLLNDLSVPLGMKPNRRFPGEDCNEIIFGNAIFIAAHNESGEKEGTVDIPEQVCQMFIEQIKLNFKPCNGDEKPATRARVYLENEGTPEERAYEWVEIEKPAGIEKAQYVQAGRAKLFQCDSREVLEINQRYFRQVPMILGIGPLH